MGEVLMLGPKPGGEAGPPDGNRPDGPLVKEQRKAASAPTALAGIPPRTLAIVGGVVVLLGLAGLGYGFTRGNPDASGYTPGQSAGSPASAPTAAGVPAGTQGVPAAGGVSSVGGISTPGSVPATGVAGESPTLPADLPPGHQAGTQPSSGATVTSGTGQPGGQVTTAGGTPSQGTAGGVPPEEDLSWQDPNSGAELRPRPQ
jgi:hypothetical protein